MTRRSLALLLCACPVICGYGHTNHNHAPHSHTPHTHTPHSHAPHAHTPHAHLSPPPPPPPPPPSPGLPAAASSASTVTYQVSGGAFSDPFFAFSPALSSSFEKGVIYTFQNAGVTGSHRFRVGTARDATPSWVTGTTGGLHAGNIGSTISMTIPLDHSGTVTYYCNPHSSMTKAVSVTAAAGDTPSPQPSPPPDAPSSPPPPKSPASSEGLSTGAIVGIAVGSAAGAALIGVGVYFTFFASSSSATGAAGAGAYEGVAGVAAVAAAVGRDFRFKL